MRPNGRHRGERVRAAVIGVEALRPIVAAIVAVTALLVDSGAAGATDDAWLERREVPIAVSADEYLVLVHERRSPGYPPSVIETLSWQRFDLVTNRLTALVELRRDERAPTDADPDTGAGTRNADAGTGDAYEAGVEETSLTAALDAFGGVPVGPSTRLVRRFRATPDGLFVVDASGVTRVLDPAVFGARLEASGALFETGSVTVLALYRVRNAYLVLVRGTGGIGAQEIVLSLPPR